nr:unnamed protein product [Spirometra erinaceieuropaei]
MSYGQTGWFGGGPWFVRAVERQCRSGGGVQKASSGPSWSTSIILRLSKPNKLTADDDYDLGEDRMKIYLESIDEGSWAAAILALKAALAIAHDEEAIQAGFPATPGPTFSAILARQLPTDGRRLRLGTTTDLRRWHPNG